MTDVSDPATESGVNTRSRLLRNWRHVMRTSNPPAGRVDPVSRWLVISRASVLPMTLTAAAIAGLLAVFHDQNVRWGLFALAAFGLVLAHVANNLMNDLFDLEVGADSDSYPRALYAPHPVLSGTISRRGLLTAAIAVNAADLVILVVLFVFRGWPMIAFALSGFALSVAYTAPPLRLKKHGLGEPTVLVVWGPLMVGGTYYAATGHYPFVIFVASLAYALLCATVLMGKHIDKIPWDAPDGTHTLPVLLGESKARALTQGMMISFYVLVILLVGTGTLPIAALIVLLALPKLAKVWGPFSQPKPAEPPEGFPIWPLWFAALAFVHTRRAGGLLVLGLIAGVILGW
ncbi:MAG TPA: prenyltransferase [Acidimicrobiia bacterium]|nr:prenyltransferase [Acidimicrobiia bacterium]